MNLTKEQIQYIKIIDKSLSVIDSSLLALSKSTSIKKESLKSYLLITQHGDKDFTTSEITEYINKKLIRDSALAKLTKEEADTLVSGFN